ncbi:hypothetical protein DRJ17_05800 [Candidatus Woesearchaeota archaeon]|nr:MAG: hypothetical protein DRJ17_05800 [Candidatus Woesearchaeota archaeon]
MELYAFLAGITLFVAIISGANLLKLSETERRKHWFELLSCIFLAGLGMNFLFIAIKMLIK